ncbi:MAG: cation:proton antiporter [Planctomycetota bacterium]|nr:cation:proton antiporter [Planctomycetota bacterium]
MAVVEDAPLLPDADPLLTLAIVVLAGVLSGMAAKMVRLPGITGQIVAGVLIGASGLHIFSEESVQHLQPVTHFALGLMAVTIGAHLNLRRLRGAWKRLRWLLLAESVVTPVLVFLGTVLLPDIGWTSALLLGALAVSTAPVTVVALVKESRSKGVFVKTLVAAVALNNIACILIFEVARTVAKVGLDTEGGHSILDGLRSPVEQLLVAFAFGGGVAVLLNLVGRFVARIDILTTAGAAAILLTSGLSEYVGTSPLLSCMFLGIIQANTVSRDKLADTVFANFEPAILATFFTLAGMHLNLEHVAKAGAAAGVFFVLRGVGKIAAVHLAMTIAKATKKVRRYLGLALLPQAGIAIGLVILLQDDPVFREHRETLDLFVAIVLTVVTMNEIAGPILTRWALKRSGDLGKDRGRLIDFLQEENITTDIRAFTKEEAIEKLVDLMIDSHHLTEIDREELLQSVLEREKQASTCLGGGLAVPHCILPEGEPLVGVMGLSRMGMTFPTPDGRPVHCMVLLGTSKKDRDRHLQVLAMLARTVGSDTAFQELLYTVDTPAHAYELLHGEESEDFNYFLED